MVGETRGDEEKEESKGEDVNLLRRTQGLAKSHFQVVFVVKCFWMKEMRDRKAQKRSRCSAQPNRLYFRLVKPFSSFSKGICLSVAIVY